MLDIGKCKHEQGLVSILRELHDALDRAVFAAYGWDDLAEKLVGLPGATTPLPDKSEAQAEAEEELLRRLVSLNHERAAEEARGLVRWLRLEYQNPQAHTASAVPEQAEAELETDEATPVSAPAGKLIWPKEMREQIQVVRNALTIGEKTAAVAASQFKRSPVDKVQAVLDSLEALGLVEQHQGRYSLV